MSISARNSSTLLVGGLRDFYWVGFGGRGLRPNLSTTRPKIELLLTETPLAFRKVRGETHDRQRFQYRLEQSHVSIDSVGIMNKHIQRRVYALALQVSQSGTHSSCTGYR